MTPSISKALLRAAVKASARAYCPYSRYRVGAALLTATGRVFTGCNVENASYGLTVCAERVAAAAAVAAGCRGFLAIAIVASGRRIPSPCGACRQVLAEFGCPDMEVLTAAAGRPERYKRATLGELLPKAFEL